MIKAATFALLATSASATCDGNPHAWDRTRRCDQVDDACPDADWASACGQCEGIGGIAASDDNDDIIVPACKAVRSPLLTPSPPVFPRRYTNDRFWEVQIFVKHDPLCLAQIPAMVSNGTHCYKPQQGTFNYDADAAALRIDYLESETPIDGVNMTEYFYHESTKVHPDITRWGINLPRGGMCPCIDLSAGIVSYDWAADAEYVGREELEVEFMWETMTLDHFVKGPHHVWKDPATSQIVRMWQPFNGLEVFDPTRYNTTVDEAWSNATFAMPDHCANFESHGCIQAFPDDLEEAFASIEKDPLFA